MLVQTVRYDVRLISRDALARYMRFRGFSVRRLAEAVPCSRATIGHLRSGRSSYVRPEWARRIEEILEAPPGSLFVAELSTVSRVTGPSGSAA